MGLVEVVECVEGTTDRTRPVVCWTSLSRPTFLSRKMTPIFTARQHSLLCMLSAVLAIVNPSVRPSVRLSVRHTLALCQNDSSYDHGVFTVG